MKYILLFLMPFLLISCGTLPERKYMDCSDDDKNTIEETYVIARDCKQVYKLKSGTGEAQNIQCKFDKNVLDVVCKDDYFPTEYFRVTDGVNKEHFLKKIDNGDRGYTFPEVEIW